MEKTMTVFTDGGASGNPGPAAVGVMIKNEDGKTIKEISKSIGRATNNVAEYSAVIEALVWIKNNLDDSIDSINFYLDSKLVVNQLNGLFKIKNSNLRNLIIEVRKLEREINKQIIYSYIPREKNRRADFLVHQNLIRNDL